MNVGNLGRDLEHCLQLRRQLHQLRGVWAQVRVSWGERLVNRSPRESGLLREVMSEAQGRAPNCRSVLTTCVCSGPLISPSQPVVTLNCR